MFQYLYFNFLSYFIVSNLIFFLIYSLSLKTQQLYVIQAVNSVVTMANVFPVNTVAMEIMNALIHRTNIIVHPLNNVAVQMNGNVTVVNVYQNQDTVTTIPIVLMVLMSLDALVSFNIFSLIIFLCCISILFQNV